MTLAEFLLARIAEDEAVARRNWDGLPVQSWPLDDDDGYASVIIAAPRVLAECEAKRRIIDGYSGAVAAMDKVTREDELVYVGARTAAEVLTLTANLLALPYADHPDYREEWRP